MDEGRLDESENEWKRLRTDGRPANIAQRVNEGAEGNGEEKGGTDLWWKKLSHHSVVLVPSATGKCMTKYARGVHLLTPATRGNSSTST